MANPEMSLDSIKFKLNEPDNYGRIKRVQGRVGAKLVTECVDKRLIVIGGAARTPGNSEGTATALIMGHQARTMYEGLRAADAMGLRSGGHRATCAYDQNLLPVLSLIANADPQVMEVYGQLSEHANVDATDRVVYRAEHAAGRLKDHKPEVTIDHIATQPGAKISWPEAPQAHARAFVLDTNHGDLVLRSDVNRSGEYYLDSHVQAIRQSDVPEEVMPEALAVSAATAVLVARAHELPILIAAGAPGNRSFTQYDLAAAA